MNKNKTDLTKKINESEENVLSEFDMQYSINELSHILDRADSLDSKIVYTVEAVPVFIHKEKGDAVYLVEQENLVKLMESQDIDTSTAISQLNDYISNEISDHDISLGIIFNKEDTKDFDRILKENISMIDTNCNIVSSRIDFLKDIKDTGSKLYFR